MRLLRDHARREPLLTIPAPPTRARCSGRAAGVGLHRSSFHDIGLEATCALYFAEARRGQCRNQRRLAAPCLVEALSR
jgi:hypothetical protein